MADILATLFRFQQFVFEFGPFLLAAWLGLAVATGLIAAAQRKGVDLRAPKLSSPKHSPLRWMYRASFFLLWRPSGEGPASSNLGGLFLFSLSASVPALVATYLIDMKTVWLRLIITVLYALSLSWFVTSALLRSQGDPPEKPPATERASGSLFSKGDGLASPPGGTRSLAKVTWRSFIGQMDRAVLPLIIGFGLAAALTIYVPAYAVGPWLGEGAWQGPYLAALLAMPLQLTGGAEVPLASALLVKGASLGAALSLMMAASSSTFLVIRRLYRSMSAKAMASYLVAVWLVAGSLGAAVDGIERLIAG